jgi:hypothetical protein
MKTLCLISLSLGCIWECAVLIVFSACAFILCRDELIGPAWRDAIDGRRADLDEILNHPRRER